MKITDYRTGSNQHKKVKKGWRWGRIYMIIAFLIAGFWIYTIATEINNQEPVHLKEEMEHNALDNDVLTPEERANIRRQAELMEEELVLKKQKATLDAKYKADSAEIEAKMEAVRKEKLGFQ